MKNCPSCQQVYPDDGPDFCVNDGTPLVRSPSEYNPGAASGGQWQQQSPYGWQPPPPPTGYGYQPPGPYPPYGYAPSSGQGEGVAKAALFTGIGSTAIIILVIIVAVAVVSGGRPDQGTLAFIGLLAILALLAGLTAIILGIVALSIVNRNPNPGASKVKAIIGLCLGIIPIVFWFISLANAGRRRF